MAHVTSQKLLRALRFRRTTLHRLGHSRVSRGRLLPCGVGVRAALLPASLILVAVRLHLMLHLRSPLRRAVPAAVADESPVLVGEVLQRIGDALAAIGGRLQARRLRVRGGWGSM